MSQISPTILVLHEHLFTDRESALMQTPVGTIKTSRYRSGVETVHISMGNADITWLPYLGGEMWDWKIDGVSQKFSGFVSEPAYQKSFLHNYGAFLIHCGVLAMGNPTKEDNHPQHGELPISKPSEAWVEFHGNDDEYPVSLCCTFSFHVPFIANYEFTPKIHIHRTGNSMIVDGKLTNTAKTPLPYQYLAHINFSYPDTGKLAYSIDRFTDQEVEMLQDAIEGVTEHPEKMLHLDKSITYDPELVAIIDHTKKAPSSFEKSQYVLNTMDRNDGSFRWVLADTHPLDHTVAWLTQTPDRAACGFSLPATSGPTGQANEKRKGNIKILGPEESTRLWYAFGTGGPEYQNMVEASLAHRTIHTK